MTWEEAQDIVQALAPRQYYAEEYRVGEKYYLPELTEYLKKECAPGQDVLEIGPGWGTTDVWMAAFGLKVTVIDVMPIGEFIRPALLELMRVRYIQQNIEEKAPEIGMFSLVVCTQVIMHLKYRPDTALRNIAKMMTPDAKLIVSVLDKHQCSDTGPFGFKWWEIPEYGKAAPTPDIITCMYNRETFEGLLSSVFNSVRVWVPKGALVLFAECSNAKSL